MASSLGKTTAISTSSASDGTFASTTISSSLSGSNQQQPQRQFTSPTTVNNGPSQPAEFSDRLHKTQQPINNNSDAAILLNGHSSTQQQQTLNFKVCDVETKIISGKKHTVYNIIAQHGVTEYKCEKRYRDFLNYHKTMSEQGIQLNAKLPVKRQIDIFNPSILAKRINCVENFLKTLNDNVDACSHKETLKFFAIDSLEYLKSTKPKVSADGEHMHQRNLSSLSTNTETTNSNEINLGSTQNYHVKPTDFDFLKHIGKGSYGKVYLAREKAENKIYAIKVLDKSHVKKKNEIKHVMAERNVMIRVIDHPFLVKIHYSFQTHDKLYFVVDFINGGELFYHLQHEQVFSEVRARFYSAEIISAIGCLHANGVIYRDLKPENILLDDEGHIKITDFGLCKEGMDTSTERTTTFCGTPEYLAPEIIRKRPYTRAVDWWCSGAVLYEMLVGMPPFYNKNYRIMHHDILHRPITFSKQVSDQAKDLLLKLLEKDPALRLGAGEADVKDIQRHDFFKPINWSLLEEKKIKPPLIYKTVNKTDLRFIDPEFTKEPVPASVVRPDMIQESAVDDAFLGFTYVDPPHMKQNS